MKTNIDPTFIPLADVEQLAKEFDEMMYYGRIEEAVERQYGPYPDAIPSPNAWATRGVFVTNGEALCESLGGHDIIEDGYAGPESGCMDVECVRCGRSWHVQLY